MKFRNRDNGRDLELNLVSGSPYWADRDGDLYLTNEIGYCWPERPDTALKLVLRRESPKNDRCSIYKEIPLKSSSSSFHWPSEEIK